MLGVEEGSRIKLPIWLPPLKVRNCPNFLVCRWCVTYRWKDLDEGYNFASDFISIKDLNTKFWAPKVTRVIVVGISRLPLGSPGTKWHLGVSPMVKHKVYYKGEGGSFPQIRAMVSLMSLSLLVARLYTKVFQLCTNQLVVWFVQVYVSKWIAYQFS
jgi:hypothetical protein